jgi:hypothetical protein
MGSKTTTKSSKAIAVSTVHNEVESDTDDDDNQM